MYPAPPRRGARRAWRLLGACALPLAAAYAGPRPEVAAVHRPLADPALAADADGRQRLKYLVHCALPPGVVVDAQGDGEAGAVRYEFPGGLGLAPAWSQRALTAAESLRVSACILARTNHYGREVELSMRSQWAARSQLTADADERARFPLYEGAFFGNIFDPDAPAYACTGEASPLRAERQRALYRVCSVPDGRRTADGRPLSACNFIIAGACDTHPFVQDGVDYSSAVIRVYLHAPP